MKISILIISLLLIIRCSNFDQIDYSSSSDESNNNNKEIQANTDNNLSINDSTNNQTPEPQTDFDENNYTENKDKLQVTLNTLDGNREYNVETPVTFTIGYNTVLNSVNKIMFDFNDDKIIDFTYENNGTPLTTKSKTYTSATNTRVTVYVIDNQNDISKSSIDITIN